VGIDVQAQGCAVVSYDSQTGEVEGGVTGTWGVGLGMPTLGYEFGLMISNAAQINDLGGPFGELGGSGEIGTVTVGGDISTGTGSNNQQIVVMN
jgi:hypothetical protein